MQAAFGIVLFVVVAVAVVAAIASLFGRSRLYDQIGRGGLSLNEDQEPTPTRAAGSPTDRQEREDEIVQMLGARNERRRRHGKAPLDIQAELARLTLPTADPGLAAEVRSLVIARNERRERAGKPPLDVETEVARQLERLRE